MRVYFDGPSRSVDESAYITNRVTTIHQAWNDPSLSQIHQHLAEIWPKMDISVWQLSEHIYLYSQEVNSPEEWKCSSLNSGNILISSYTWRKSTFRLNTFRVPSANGGKTMISANIWGRSTWRLDTFSRPIVGTHWYLHTYEGKPP